MKSQKLTFLAAAIGVIAIAAIACGSEPVASGPTSGQQDTVHAGDTGNLIPVEPDNGIGDGAAPIVDDNQGIAVGETNPTTPDEASPTDPDFDRDAPHTDDIVIEGPGPERDGVAYFLFDTALEPCPGGDGGGLVCDDLAPKGYSQYFGSALAVLLRSQGVPARMVSGFKSGTFDEERAGFLIRDVDSHGWAQAYFPGYGWIDMESTPGEPQLVRGALPTLGVPASGGASTFAAGRDDFSEVGRLLEGTGDGPDLDELLSLLGRDSGTPVWPFIVGLGVILALSGSVLAWRWRFWAMSPTGRAYASMSRLGWLAGAGRRKPETPMEYALRLGESARDADEGAQAIARAFELEAYGGRPVPEAVHEAVRSEWPAVRWALVRRSLLRLVHVRPRPPLRVVMAEPMERPLYSSLKSTETEG